MSKGAFPRILALLGALILALQPVAATAESADAADRIEVISGAGESIEIAGPFDDALPLAINDGDALTEPEPETPDVGGEEPTLEGPAPEETTGGDDDPQDPVGEEEPVEPVETETRAFSQTAEVGKETWKDVNLVRAEGFTGKLAAVSGRLTLENVQIEGQPAEDADLLDYFDLAPKAGISCSGASPLRLSFSALSINKGASKTLKLLWNGRAVDGGKAAWKVSDEKYVRVKNGRITARKKGVAWVSAKYKGQKVLCYLDITGIVYPEELRMSKSLSLSLNNTVRLKAKVLPKNADDPSVTWTSSKPSVVSVDADGNLAGLAVGKATVTATACNGLTAKCRVTVQKVSPKSLDFRTLYVTMHPGETFQTDAVLKPLNNSFPQLLYDSDDPSVATVDENGVVTALACGTTTVTATSAYKPKLTNTCKVCVIDPDGPPLAGLIIGINPGHQIKTVKKQYPLAPGSHRTAKGVKTGASGRVTRQHEYEVVLQIGLKLKRMLEEDGATVVITRTKNDVMLTNIDRAKMLNEAGVDVALQLHNDSCSNHSKSGVDGYYRSTGKWVAESHAIAKALCKGVSKASGLKNRGLHVYNDYMSLNWTTTPTVLMELGYLSNASDDRLLAKDSFREKIARGLYDGLCAYFGR